MPSHGARRLIRERPLRPGFVEAELELDCGCVVTRELALSRIAELVDGRRFPAGKYPCPAGHPVRSR